MSSETNNQLISLLPQNWDLPKAIRRRLGQQAGRQRCMSAENHLLLVLHEPPTGAEISFTGRFFWRRPEGSWTSNCLGDHIDALEQHLDEFDFLLDKLEEKELIARTADEYFTVIEELIPLHRSAENLYLAIQSARESQPEDLRLIDCRDQAYEIFRSSDLLLNDCKAAMDYAIAKRAEEQSRYSFELAASANRMNTLIAIFLPLATLSSIFGMNLTHGYENRFQPFGFFGVITFGLVLGLALKYLLLNKPVEIPQPEVFDAPILNRKPNPQENADP
ncbi:MAG: hypothetical protein HUJ26_15110 [Planctomycetaceae bacterium]|nr:hypothetical protein [Planctomycetaceae bacterium]